MKTYKVKYSENVIAKIDELIQFIASINTKESSTRYALDLYDEISKLSYLADIFPDVMWETSSVIYPHTKRLLVKKGKLTVFYVIYRDYVLVYDIVPSSLVTKDVDSTI